MAARDIAVARTYRDSVWIRTRKHGLDKRGEVRPWTEDEDSGMASVLVSFEAIFVTYCSTVFRLMLRAAPIPALERPSARRVATLLPWPVSAARPLSRRSMRSQMAASMTTPDSATVSIASHSYGVLRRSFSR
jgi:hypothetical protein